eukprot:gb/GECG01013145.1/.p1 GENE.gb/GECG01013145.1/~~gb/GECG01013145.1/.p1  ORF type:complete len:193 (+),score=25.61 gb/GECG01013145.1/:1-579(+)
MDTESANIYAAQEDEDRVYLQQACALAFRCSSVDTAYNVGAVIVQPHDPEEDRVVATGFSRELPGNTHAEECALEKAKQNDRKGTSMIPYCVQLDTAIMRELLHAVENAILYSSMEPCSHRLSGKKPCTERIIEARIRKVVLALREPQTFVENCQGVEQLRSAGIEVVALEDGQFQSLVKQANQHITSSGCS